MKQVIITVGNDEQVDAIKAVIADAVVDGKFDFPLKIDFEDDGAA